MMSRGSNRIGRLLTAAALLAALSPAGATAAPFRPVDDGEVLERLPFAPGDPEARRLASLRTELARRPSDLRTAARVAWEYIQAGRRLSDPRYFGYAQGALGPWWTDADPPVPILVLRATIRQHDHDFANALDDLARAVRAEPTNAQAWLTRAVILQVRGQYEEARESCMQVLQLADPLVAVTCLGNVDALSGRSQEGYELVAKALARAPDADAGARRWAWTTLAEVAARTGRPDAAEAHYEEALRLGEPDEYLLGSYADFLLERSRPAEVRALLGERTRVDALLLRLALAEQMEHAGDLAAHVEMLQERFDAARLRGDDVHRREESRFELHLRRDPATALRLARENWEVQREPWDTRILLEAALAAGDRDAAGPALEFRARSGLEDTALSQLAERLTSAADAGGR